jgi:hypothetical protein
VPLVDPIPQLKREAGAALADLLAPWKAHDVAAIIGTDAPRIRDICRGNLERFSLETLIRYLTRVGQRVELRFSEDRTRRRDSPR